MARRKGEGSYTVGGEEVREESSWRYPLTIFLVTLILCALFLYIYVGPDIDELQGATPKPTISDERAVITVGDVALAVPASHTIYPRDRRPGEREELLLYAAWPRMDGYSPARKVDFTEDKPNSRRIDLMIETKGIPFGELDRLETLYLPQTIDGRGEPFEHGLVRYAFREGSATRPASGYADKEMLVGETTDGTTAVLFCYEGSEDEPVPPECYRQYDLTDGVSVRYRFKRPYLAEWRRIDERVRDFVEELRTEAPA